MYNYSGKFKRNYRNKTKSEINVTPFVDVMLVLLIVFMLTSHIISNGIEVDLPKYNNNFSEQDSYITITIDQKSLLYIDNKVIKQDLLIKKLQAILKENPKIQILLSGDRKVHYGKVIEIFGILKKSDIHNVVLFTEE
ncbi:MAG: biopolymer transport protein TolR [Candidatus Midichloriaceae bacterium]|jgi:biopolymer transport protein TolR